MHRTPQRRQRQTVVLQIHQLPIGKPPGFRPCVLLPQGIPGLRRRRGRHDGSFVPLIRAALIAEPFPPGGQKLSALCAARPWIFVSDVRSFHPLRDKVESSAGVEPAPSRRAAGAHPHAPAAHMGGLFFPGTPSASGIGPHYKTRREGGLEPHYAAGRVLDLTLREGVISPSPTPTPSGRGMCAVPRGRSVPAVMRSCLPHCHCVHPGRGSRSLPAARACLLAVPPSDRLPERTGFIPGAILPAGMVAGFRPERHLFPQCEAVLGFTQTCQKRSVPMSFEGSRSRTITPLGSGIPPAAAPSFRGASMGRKESIRETGIEPAFS